jgi:hypothetical protein
MSKKSRIRRTLEKFLLFSIVTIGCFSIYILNLYKAHVSQDSLEQSARLIENAPSYTGNIYKIFGAIEKELDTSNNCIHGYLNYYGGSPSRKLASYLNPYGTLTAISFALKLERNVSNKKIVDHLLTELYFGYNIQGIDSAAQFFYSKKTGDLMDKQLISICAMIKGNTTYNPLRNPEKNKQRTDLLIEKLKTIGIPLDTSCD